MNSALCRSEIGTLPHVDNPAQPAAQERFSDVKSDETGCDKKTFDRRLRIATYQVEDFLMSTCV
jgi:hypothetical protein